MYKEKHLSCLKKIDQTIMYVSCMPHIKIIKQFFRSTSILLIVPKHVVTLWKPCFIHQLIFKNDLVAKYHLWTFLNIITCFNHFVHIGHKNTYDPFMNKIIPISHINNMSMSVDEIKRAKIDVKTSTFLQFLWHLSMWCHFNGMWIMESCAYWIIWILKKFKWIKQNFNTKVWFE
jgi:hypothetical protein